MIAPPTRLFVGTLLLRIKDRRLSRTLQNTTKDQDETEDARQPRDEQPPHPARLPAPACTPRPSGTGAAHQAIEAID